MGIPALGFVLHFLHSTSDFGLELDPFFFGVIMASLEGVVAEWDSSEVIRQRMRDGKHLIVKPPLKADVHINVECGEVNYDALAPLAKRLQDAEGNVGMHTVPAIQHQSLWIFIHQCLIHV